MAGVITIRYEDGTLLLERAEAWRDLLASWCVWDERVSALRAEAMHYAPILRALHRAGVAYADEARAYARLSLRERRPLRLRQYQQAALRSWEQGRRCGVVVLPTGAGKTYVALRAILACQRSCLVVAPTIDLVHQWADELGRRLGCPIGQYGGGEKVWEPITVATYDSAALVMPHAGHRFGLLVIDECHHLPATHYATIASCCLAPWRLGLSATPERDDGGHERLDALLGPIVHRSDITELEGSYLAAYQSEVLAVAMDEDELAAYQDHRRVYRDYIRRSGIDMRSPDGWASFIASCSRDSAGREVLRSYREQKRLSRASRAKLRVTWELLRRHAGERCIVFTDDNDTAYRLGRGLILPVLTHHTKGAERKALLAGFRAGELPVLVTSRVLNEGVDVPEASVGIVISGTGSVREHVQRLGRILRPGPDKVALLYELISAGTAEAFTSSRRRSHIAFGLEEGETPGSSRC